MPDGLPRQSARIYAFTAKGSLSETRTRSGERMHKQSGLPANAVFGSAWYHEAAIADAEPKGSEHE
jgi:hypothetical protein